MLTGEDELDTAAPGGLLRAAARACGGRLDLDLSRVCFPDGVILWMARKLVTGWMTC